MGQLKNPTFKRAFDFLFALLLILLTLPLQIFIMVYLFIVFKKNPFFLQRRGLTLEKKLFRIIKYRTLDDNYLIQIVSNKDRDIFKKPLLRSRLNPYALWLRKTGLDELPQLYNILFGNMSFVGPRPLMISDLLILKKANAYNYEIRNQLDCKPGLTGLWQLFGDRNRGSFNLVSLDTFYHNNQNFYLDIALVLYSISRMLQGRNSDAILMLRNNVEYVPNLILKILNIKVNFNEIIEKINYNYLIEKGKQSQVHESRRNA
ncbi:MAG: sugar transferase [Melioribacteraceae bacterium]|nr:sugar transferase [Melioribacteraceae bacterium]MCF8265620.1 sugar transferase [Melioribacteraceae bacterium]MCF8432240.1 sugar transferase [Melioribacteraceae bacterium]